MSTGTSASTTALMKLVAQAVNVALDEETDTQASATTAAVDLQSLSTAELDEMRFILRTLAELLDAMIVVRAAREG